MMYGCVSWAVRLSVALLAGYWFNVCDGYGKSNDSICFQDQNSRKSFDFFCVLWKQQYGSKYMSGACNEEPKIH